MMEKKLEFEMSLPQSMKDIVLNVAVAMSLGATAAGRGGAGGMTQSGSPRYFYDAARDKQQLDALRSR